LETPEAAYEVFNVGSGQAYTINEIAANLSRILGKEHITPDVCGKYRIGDIRHCFSDISKAKAILGYKPNISLEQGLMELADWLDGQTAEDKVAEARNELATRGLTV
jgi:dTDP-L-rhamnose 4-epimerase